ncbi:hypothetical protein MCP_0835 [Methanocella paludicola SANAE]|uniref:Uncharacterized protein n=1 Tax=Methanocella paludicola (strain DSM 17711 / JCM 13418 / NBRC 101707 / SANAE) TaxID=304371 RepID=D1YWT5_METPS|nr:hypothetical protein [Methanocella paludicola]BAI60907.1 hypothetical protein MCP_0835 [Methanocella paludicola SANAE]
MGFTDYLVNSFRRIALAVVGLILLLIAGSLALSYTLRLISYTIWYLTPIMIAVVAIVGLIFIAYAVLIKE